MTDKVIPAEAYQKLQELIYEACSESIGYASQLMRQAQVLLKSSAQPLHKPEKPVRLTFGALTLDVETQQAFLGEELLPLSRKEFDFFAALLAWDGATVSKGRILDQLYPAMHNRPDPKVVDVFAFKLRKKLRQATGGKISVKTVWGRGYALQILAA